MEENGGRLKKKIQVEDGEDFKQPQIYIDQLYQQKIENPNVFHEKAILDEIATVLIGGSETSALTVAWSFLMLAMYPDVQQKVYEEVQSVFITDDPMEYVDFEAISKLNYMEQVIRETMRLFPIGPIIGRKTIGEVKIGE